MILNKIRNRSKSCSPRRHFIDYCERKKERLNHRLFTTNEKYRNYISCCESESSVKNITTMSIRKSDDRYTNILREVKKILKNDNISKRKLKYILRNQNRIFFPKENLRSLSEDKYYVFKSQVTPEIEKMHMDNKTLQKIDNNVSTQILKNLNDGYSNPDLCIVENAQKSHLLQEKFINFPSNLADQSVIKSRSPSPALPLLRDEAMLSNYTSTHQLVSLKVKASPKKLVAIDRKSCRNLVQSEKYSSKLLQTKKTLSKTSKLSYDLRSPIYETRLSNEYLTSLNKCYFKPRSSLLSHESCSRLRSRSYSRPLTPSNVSSASKHSSPILLLENNVPNLLLRGNNGTYLETNKYANTNLERSCTPTSLTSEKSISPISYLHNYTNKFSNHCKKRRSISISKRTRSTSRSLSRNSRNDHTRSCSKGSPQTVIRYNVN